MEQIKLKQVLNERGISANKLAMECRISSPTIYSILSGNLKAFPNYKKKISEYLKMSEDELFIED